MDATNGFLDRTAHAQPRNFEIAGRWKCVRWFGLGGGGGFWGFFLVGCFVDVDGGGRRGVVEAGEGEGVRALCEGSGARIRGSGRWRGRLKGGGERIV